MAEGKRMSKSELFSHFAEKFDMKRSQAREFFDELNDCLLYTSPSPRD